MGNQVDFMRDDWDEMTMSPIAEEELEPAETISDVIKLDSKNLCLVLGNANDIHDVRALLAASEMPEHDDPVLGRHIVHMAIGSHLNDLEYIDLLYVAAKAKKKAREYRKLVKAVFSYCKRNKVVLFGYPAEGMGEVFEVESRLACVFHVLVNDPLWKTQHFVKDFSIINYSPELVAEIASSPFTSDEYLTKWLSTYEPPRAGRKQTKWRVIEALEARQEHNQS